MTEVNFDLRGNLIPQRKIKMSLKTFQQSFVDKYDKNSTRYALFENFEIYINSFKTEIISSFKIWIDGSFVSNKRNPNDIDFVCLIDNKTAIVKTNTLKNKFVNQAALGLFNLDAYVLVVYPENHKDFLKGKADMLYWYHWFTHTKKNRNKTRFPKGFVEIEFE